MVGIAGHRIIHLKASIEIYVDKNIEEQNI
jgi:hypothetical protein